MLRARAYTRYLCGTLGTAYRHGSLRSLFAIAHLPAIAGAVLNGCAV